MNTRLPSSRSTLPALLSTPLVALALALPLLAAACSSSSPSPSSEALDNWSCSCGVTDSNAGTVANATYAYCGVSEVNGGSEAELEAETWADNHCSGKNPTATCTCVCTDLGTTCTTATAP